MGDHNSILNDKELDNVSAGQGATAVFRTKLDDSAAAQRALSSSVGEMTNIGVGKAKF